jgi:hypothetical protein
VKEKCRPKCRKKKYYKHVFKKNAKNLLTNHTREQPGKAIQTQNTTPTRITWARANLVSKGMGAPFCYLSGHDGRSPGSPARIPKRRKTHFKAKSIKMSL